MQPKKSGNKNFILTTFLVTWICAIALISCSNNNNDDDNNKPAGHYIPYRGSLNVVNSVNFNKQTISANNILSAVKLQSYDYDVTTKSITGIKDHFVVYIDNNRVWKLDITKDSNLVPQQVSSADMSDYCGTEYVYTFFKYQLSISNPEDTFFLYQTAGIDGDCNNTADNRVFMIRANDTPSTAPTDVTNITGTNSLAIYVLFDNANIESGASHILVNNYIDNTLYRYDTNLENPVEVTTATRSITNANYERPHIGGMFLIIDDDLYWYDAETQSLSSSLFTHTDEWNEYPICENDSCYFSVKDTSGNISIYSIAPDGSSSAQPLALNIFNSSQTQIGATTENFLIRSIYNDLAQTSELYKIPKSGGTPVLLDSSYDIYIYYTNDSNIYYNKIQVTLINGTPIATATAMIIDENNTVIRQFPNALWIGGQFESIGRNFSASELVQLKNISEYGNYSNAILQTFDVNRNELTTILGTLPDGAKGINIISGFDATTLAYVDFTGFVPTPPYYFPDVFALDLTRENSLTRITNTPDIAETEIY